MPLKELDSDGLQAVRDADAMVATDDELQFYPPSYTHRRQLLQRLDAAETALAEHDRLTAELSRLVWGVDSGTPAGGNWSLAELVAEIRSRVEMQQGHAAAMVDNIPAAPPPVTATLMGPDGPVMELGEGITDDAMTFGDTWSCSHGFAHPVGDVCNHTEKDRF